MKNVYLLSLAVAATPFIVACGGGSGNSSSMGSTVTETVEVSGAGVKGPLAGAAVEVYSIDYAAENFRGALLGSGSTGTNAAITGLSIPNNTSGKVIVEFKVDDDTVDITSGTAPEFSRLITVVDASSLISGEDVYASLLTTMATELAMNKADAGSPYSGNGDTVITEPEFEAALQVAQGQVKSTLGFGISSDIDIFTVPPLITNATDTTEEQTEVAAYRQANEALAAIVIKVAEESTAEDNPEEILDALVEDLSDGNIDGQNEEGVVEELAALDTNIETTLETTDPSTLNIPGTTTSISDIEDVLVSEKATTGSLTETAGLEDGSIEIEPESASTEVDTDQDGVIDQEDAFPNDPEETSDSDNDGVGDNNDAFPEDATEWADTDEDQVGDNADSFPEDPSESVDTDNDGVGDNGDAFPDDPTETADTDNDGVGDNSDAYPNDPERSVVDSVDLAMWIGADDTLVSFPENNTSISYNRSSQVDCDYELFILCKNVQIEVVTDDSTITDSTSQLGRDSYHQFSVNERVGELDIGIDRWIKRKNTAVLTFNDRIWLIGGNDGINDGLDDQSSQNNDGPPEGYDGGLARDVWSSQDGNTWVNLTADAPFGARQSHSVVAFQGKMWLIGGSTYNTQTQNFDVLNDVWSSTDGKNWTQETSSAPFSARTDPALVVFDDKLFLIGGRGDDYVGKSDVWYTENGSDWVQATDDTGFRGQDYPNIVNFNNKLWLVGGSSMYSKVWSSVNGKDWVEETETNYADLTRNVSAVAVHDNKIWVVGGFDNDSYNDEVWYSEDGLSYVEVPKAEGHYIYDRVEAGLVSFRERLWIIGGRRSSAYGDVLSTTDGASWYRHSFGPEELTQRYQHSFVAFNDKLFSFAGQTYQPDATIWSSTNGLAWTKESENSPFQYRYDHATIEFNDKLWIVGGTDRTEGTATSVQQDIWSSNDGLEWTQEITEAPFGMRRGHQIVEWNGKLWLVAGFDGMYQGEKNDVWSSTDGITWVQETESAGFPVRYDHGVVVFDNKLWVIGGINTTSFEYHTDVWSSDDGVNWTQVTDNVEAMFRPNDFGYRTGFISYVRDNKIFLMGGKDSAEYLSDVWSTTDGINWTLENADTGMSGRKHMRMTHFNGELMLQGGAYQDGLAFYQKDIWKSVDGINWRTGFKSSVDLLAAP